MFYFNVLYPHRGYDNTSSSQMVYDAKFITKKIVFDHIANSQVVLFLSSYSIIQYSFLTQTYISFNFMIFLF